MTDILKWNGVVYSPEPPEATLQKAKKWDMDGCMILGFTKRGEFIMGGSFSDIGEMLILLERARDDLNQHLRVKAPTANEIEDQEGKC